MLPSVKIPTISPDLRQKVYSLVDKLSDRATFSKASSELNAIAGTLPENDLQSLSTFLTCILSIDGTSKPSVRVHCLNLLSLLAETHTFSLCPFLPKLIVPSLLRRLRDADSAVRSACAAACGSLAPLGLFFLLVPLIGSVAAETETNAQIGACWCLKAAIDGADDVSGADVAEMGRGMVRFVKMVRGDGCTAKAKAAVLGVIGSIVGVNGGEVVNKLVGNVVECAVEMLSCEDWAARKSAAEVLEAVAVVAESELVGEVTVLVVGSLESRRFDKVKATRDSMNKALEAWKKIPDYDWSPQEQEDLSLSTSNSTFSKDNGKIVGNSPCMSRRSSFAGIETTSKQKKMMNKTMSSLYDSSSSSSSTSTSRISLQTPHKKMTMAKPKPETPQSKEPTTSKVVSEDSYCESEAMEVEERALNVGSIRRSGSRVVVPFIEEKEPEKYFVEHRTTREVSEIEKNEDHNLSQIRNQLFQIERQQSDLLDLLMRFMGNSQSRIDSLETRVSRIERALIHKKECSRRIAE